MQRSRELEHMGVDELTPAQDGGSIPERINFFFSILGRADVDLFASEENAHCLLHFSRQNNALTQSWSSCHLYAFPPIALLPQVIRRIEKDNCTVMLVTPRWPNQPWFPELIRMLSTALCRIPLKKTLGSPPRAVKPTCMAPRRESLPILRGVLTTITEARAPFTRRLYSQKWAIFTGLCKTRCIDQLTCEIVHILSFLQQLSNSSYLHEFYVKEHIYQHFMHN